MCQDEYKTVTLDNVIIQENGIIRNSKGNVIARLVDQVHFEDDCIQKEAVFNPKFKENDKVEFGCFGYTGTVTRLLERNSKSDVPEYIIISDKKADPNILLTILLQCRLIVDETCLRKI